MIYFNVREYAVFTGAKIKTDKEVSEYNFETGAI
jgi:hypothetical protein